MRGTKSHQRFGLAIANSLIELHGGSMRIRSTQRVGTIVLMGLPCRGVTDNPKRMPETVH